jgi:hypothetical protein
MGIGQCSLMELLLASDVVDRLVDHNLLSHTNLRNFISKTRHIRGSSLRAGW